MDGLEKVDIHMRVRW